MSAVLKPRLTCDSLALPPHYKSFADVADARLRRAKEYEQYLLFVLDNCPGMAPQLAPALAWARAEQTRSKSSDRQKVFRALAGFEWLTCTEIVEESALPPATVYKLLRQMIAEGLVERAKRPVFGNNAFRYVYRQKRALPLPRIPQ